MSALEPQLGVVYRTPLGRHCVLVPVADLKRVWDGKYTLRYIDGQGGENDAFALTRGNVRLLQRVAAA